MSEMKLTMGCKKDERVKVDYRESCNAPTGGGMSDPCVADTSITGLTDESLLGYKIIDIQSTSSSFICCRGYGKGGWHSLGCYPGHMESEFNLTMIV